MIGVIKLNIKDPNGVRWFSNGSTWVVGRLFANDGTLYDGPTLLEYFADAVTLSAIIEKLVRANGNFAVVIKISDGVVLGVDHISSYPLFFKHALNGIEISNEVQHLNCDKEISQDNDRSIREFLSASFLTEGRTLLNDVWQVEAGECVFVSSSGDHSFSRHAYHSFVPKKYMDELSESELLATSESVSEAVSSRLLKVVGDRQVVIPLSGGLDSRYVAAMLKKKGKKDVVCFSYGRKGNSEATISKRVAEELGYRWYFVDYSENTWGILGTAFGKKYMLNAGQFATTAHIQDFPAVKYLQDRKLISEDAIFVPGHSGDLLGGSHIPQWYQEDKKYTLSDLRAFIVEKHYSRNSVFVDDLDFNQIIFPNLEKQVLNARDFLALGEDWNVKNRQAKYIVNSIRVYDFFGYSWYLPLFDKDLCDFWFAVPPPYRLNKALYIRFLEQSIFRHLRINFGSYTPLVQVPFVRGLIRLLPQETYRLIRKITFGKCLPNNTDPVNFSALLEVLGSLLGDECSQLQDKYCLFGITLWQLAVYRGYRNIKPKPEA